MRTQSPRGSGASRGTPAGPRSARDRSTALALLLAAATLAGTPLAASAWVVDHRHVELFEQIPPEYLQAARELRLLFSDRSVGQNINDGLNCLTASSWPAAGGYCRRDYYDDQWHWKQFSESDWNLGLVPARILFAPDPVTYDRSLWTYELRTGSWEELTCDFVQSLAPSYLPTKDVLSYQFSYLNVMENDDIADPVTGFFAARPGVCDIDDLEALIEANPDKRFFFWTTSLARGIGTSVSTEFNDQMRTYCAANGRVLFDAADILAHTDQGAPCLDNRDGLAYVSQSGASENYPDDGFDYPAICQDWTTEVDGGHLGSVSGGMIAVVKGLWVLMAMLAGWEPEVNAVGEPAVEEPVAAGHEPILTSLGPNPAGSELTVRFALPNASELRIELFDAGGRARMLRDLTGLPAGPGRARLDLRELPSGAYLLRLASAGSVATERIVVLP